MSKTRAVGIDLGTTSSAISYVDEMGRSAMFRDPQGQLLIPSMVFFEDDELVFGSAAKQAASTQPNRIAENVKRDLGQAAYSRAINGQLLPVAVVEACLLKRLRDEVSSQGTPAVVLTMPACFNQAQREALLDAARLAGLDVLGTINDTMAAALAFAEQQGYLHPAAAGKKSAGKLLVFDLGGGMLDAAIVEIKPGQLRTMAVAGDVRLGGRDWDQRLADLLAAAFEKQFGQDPRYDLTSVRRLVQAAEEAKQTLSTRPQARVRVERSANSSDVTITRETFEAATADLVDRCRRIAEQVRAHSGLEWRDLAQLLMVGGATRMPAIGKLLESLTGMTPLTTIHPDEAGARGAALYAEKLLAARESREPAIQVQLTGLTPRSLGVEWTDPGTNRAENVVIIPRGTELPCGTATKIVTQVDDQRSMSVQLLEGENRNAEECARIGAVNIRDLPPNLPRQTPIEMHYEFTAEGRLNVRATLPATGKAVNAQWQHDGASSREEEAGWKQIIAANAGLNAIHARLAQTREPELAAAAPVPGNLPVGRLAPDEPTESDSQAGEMDNPMSEIELLSMQNAAAGMLRKANKSPKNVAIIVAGYVFSSLLGLALGYYILMWLRPELNYWHLRLPGLTFKARSSGTLSPGRAAAGGSESRPLSETL